MNLSNPFQTIRPEDRRDAAPEPVMESDANLQGKSIRQLRQSVDAELRRPRTPLCGELENRYGAIVIEAMHNLSEMMGAVRLDDHDGLVDIATVMLLASGQIEQYLKLKAQG